VTATSALGHRPPWGYDCPGWPYCHQARDDLVAAITDYERAIRLDPSLGPHLADAIDTMRTELDQREPAAQDPGVTA
jgi:hypothetical protein